MTADLQQAIGRLRRAQPRNPDTMAVCEALERALVQRLGDVVPVKSGGVAMVQPIPGTPAACPECARRRQQTLTRVRRLRGKAPVGSLLKPDKAPRR